ncbi:MAG: hypothetical protein HQM08_20665 [Candidatus Riflebacteria bacterium]|nr:hypothetical protein [Candidatus Riflebacteria bacterium]
MDQARLVQQISNYTENRNKLLCFLSDYRIRRQFKSFFIRLFISLSLILFLFIIFLLADRTFLSADFFRWIQASVLCIGGITLLFWILRTFLAPPSNIKLAEELEEADPKMMSGLISSVEFTANDSPRGVSMAMIKLAVSDTVEKFKSDTIRTALSNFQTRIPFAILLFFCILIGAWNYLSPREVSVGLSRLLKPFAPISPFSDFSMQITPGNKLIAKGESVLIAAFPSNPPEKEPVLTLFTPNETTGHPTEMFFDETSSHTRYVFTLNSLQESTDYQVSATGFTSERYSITVLPRPEVKSFIVTLIQPSYLGTEPITLPEGAGDAVVLAGTKFQIKGKASQPVVSAVLSLDPPATLSCRIDQKDFFGEMNIATTTRYSILIKSSSGLTNENPVKYQITAVEDASPTVEIIKPGTNLPFPKSRKVDLKVLSRDDFGVVSLVLYYSCDAQRHFIPQNLKANFAPMKEFEVEFPWMLDTIPVMPGTEIEYYIKAEDCMKPAPHVATSPTFKITMPSYYDVYKGNDEGHGDVSKKIKEIMENQKYRRDALQKTYEKIKHEGKIDEETKKQLEEQVRLGEEHQKQSEEALQKFSTLQEKLKDNPFSSPESLEKMQKVQELMTQILDDEGRKLLKQLQESVKNTKIDPKDMEKYEQAFKMENYLKGLDRSIELLTKMRDEMKKNAIGEALQDLQKRQQTIASETENLEKKASENKITPEEESKLQTLQKQQDKIREELESLKKETEELASKKPKEGEQPDPSTEDMKNISDRMKNEDFKKTSDEIKKSLEEKQFQQAREHQQKMLKFLEALSKDGKKMCQTCMGGSGQSQLDLSRFIRQALQVSHDQESLYYRLDGIPPQFMRGQMPAIEGKIGEVSGLQMLVKRQAERLEEALETYVKMSFAVDPSVLLPLKGVQEMLSDTIKDLEDRQIEKSRDTQREIIKRFNRLAMELMRAQDQQQNSSQAMNPKNALQQFKQLTQRQLSLYQQTQKNSLSPADQQEMERLRQMAMEQRMIRESLERLMHESKEQMQTLGRMEDVMNDMEKLETKILDPKLKREVAEKQKSIYERMLKAQKSLKDRDEKSEERKAQKAGEISQVSPDKPLPQAGSETRDLSRDFLREMREKYPKSYENEIRDYYKSLNLYNTEFPNPVVK